MATSPANGADPLVGQSLGQFEIVELIGRGGMGAVYKARQPSLDRWVAIKILSPALSEDAAFVARFAREARAAAAVSHRNIIEIIDVATAGGYHYIAMGYVDGESLAALIHREGRLPQDRALGIMKQTTAALAAAHEAGIIHRDIKPSNILLDRSGEVRVSDFGLAKRLAADASTSTDEQPLGTPAYVSPEMATGKEVDARTDLYSLGATFFHALAGHPPFEGESFSDLIVKVVREPAPPLAEVVSDVDPRLCGIIDRLLRKDPAERPASAQALANELGTLGELHSPAQAAQDEARRLLREAPTVPLTQGRRLAHKAAIERLRREREKSGKRRLLLAATVVGIGLLAALTLPRLLRPSGAPDAGVQLREHNAQSLFQNAKAAAAIGDWAAAQKWLDELSQDYSDTKFVSASRAAVEELRGQIAKGKQAAVPPPVPEVQVRVDEATRTITTDKIKVRWDPSHANRILALELNSVPGLNLTTPVVLRPEATGGCEFTGNAATADDLTLAGLLIGLQCEAQQWTSRYLDSAHKRAEVATRWQRVGRAPVETSFWLAADSARIDFQRTFRFSSTPHTNRLKGLIPFYWYTNGIGLPFTYSRAGKEPGRATAQDFGLAVADWDGRWADMGQIAYFHKPCEHAVTLFGDWDGQAKGSRAAPALSEMRTFTSDVTICGALFLHEQGLGTEEIEKEYERFLKQQREVPGVKLATVSFTAPAESKGLEAISEGEGQFTTAEREGRPALCQERGYLYFRAADDFAKLFQADTGRTALVTTSLLDATPGTVCIEYDSHIENPGEPVGLTAWRRSQRRSLRGTGRWTEVKFELPAARFGHRQNYGADFRLWHDVPLSVNQVTVTAIEEERPPNVPPLLEKGLAAAFYAGQNHERFLVAQRAPWVNFDWRLEAPMPNVPKDAFSTRIVGWLYVPQAGEYTFWFWRDDGVRFYLDGKKLIDDWAPHMGACEPAAVQLGAGWHRLWVEHMEVLNEANISLHWRRGDRDGIVPATLFYCERELLERIRRDPTQDPFAGLKPDTPVKGMEQLAAPPAVEQAEWVSLFDGKTLDGWEVNNQGAFAHHGPVRVEDGRILMCMGGYGTGIRYKGDVPSTNYEIAWEGMRLRGRDWFSILVFPVGSSWCRLEAGGRGANRESGNAFHLAEVDGRVFPGPMTFENDTWYRFRVRVTDAYVEASVDGGPTLKIARAGRRLSSMDLYSTFQPLGFCTWGCDAAQRSIRLRRLKPEEGARAPLPERPGARWALEFDGQTSYVSIPSLRYSGTHPITVEAVVTLPAAGFRGCVVGDTQFGGVSIDLSGAYWVFQVHDGHQYVKARSDEAAVEGRAVSLAGVFDGQRVSLYVNGRRQSSALVLNGPFTASALPVTVGASPAPPGPEAPGFDWPFRGIIHSVRVSKTARYTADFTPLRRFAADPDTLLLLHLDEGQGDIARDSSGKGHHGTIKGAKWVKVDEYAAEKAAPPRLACRLLATLTGHAGWVTSVAFSPDGTLVATASRDRTLKLWEPATGKCLRTFQGHLGWAECVAFSPDGKRLASASMDGTVRVWDIETTRCLVTLDLQRVPTRALAFPSDGKCLASGSDDGVIRLWDVAAEKCVKTMTDPDDRMQVQFLTFSADGKRILTCGTDGKARLWDAATGACLRKQLGPTHEIWCVGFSPDGQRTLSVGTDPAVRVWSADTGAALKVLPTPTVNRGVSFSPDGRWIAASGWQGWLHFWDAATYERLESLRGHQADIFKHAFSPDSKRLASAGFDSLAKVWELVPGGPAEEKPLVGAGEWTPLFDGKTLDGWSVAKKLTHPFVGDGTGGEVYVKDGQLVLEPGRPMTGFAWTRAFPETDYEIELEATRLEGHCDFASLTFPAGQEHCTLHGAYDGQFVGLSRVDGLECRNNETRRAFRYENGRWYRIRLQVTAARVRAWIDETPVVDFARAGHVLTPHLPELRPFGVWNWEGKSAVRSIRVRRLKPEGAEAPQGRAECRLLVTLKGHSTWVVCAAFSPDGKRVASGAGDRTVKLWDVATGQCLKTFRGHLERVESVAFSPDGQRLFSSSFDKTVRIWDVDKGECIRTLVGHTDTVSGMALSPDGKRVASGSADERIRIWDTATGECLRILTDPTGPMHVRTIAFSRDGSRIVSGGHDGHLRFWDVETGRCLRKWPAASGKLCAVVICPDGERIVSVGDDLAVKVWSLATGASLKVIETAGQNRGLAVSPDGKWIATGTDYTGILRFWDAATFEPVCTVKGHQSAAFKLDFSPDSKRLASASFDGTVKVWAIAPGEGVPADAPAAAPHKPLALPPGGQWLSLFDGKTLDGWRVVPAAGGGRAGSVEVRDGQIVLGAGTPQTAIAWAGGFPTTDYEVRVEATRILGRSDFCSIVFPLGAAHCTWVIGGYGGETTGITLFDNSQANWNETTQTLAFQQGRQYQVRLRVTKARLQGWVDDEQVLDSMTAGHTFALLGFAQQGAPFGVFASNTTAGLRSISVRAVTPGPDDGPRPDEPPAGAKPVETATVAVAARVNWFDTGLYLSQGKAYELSASGRWGTCPWLPTYSAEGIPGRPDPRSPLVGTDVLFALVGRVGALGRPFHVGERLGLTPETTGRLYLRMNDVVTWDNWGSLRVTVAGPLLADADGPLLARFTNEVRKLSPEAKSDWTDSGVAVQPGDELLIAAAGTWQAGPLRPPADADGYQEMLAFLRRGALVGKIGEQGRPFHVGQLLLLDATKAGKLYLAMNDDARDDNQGSLIVTISAPATRPRLPDGKAGVPTPLAPKKPEGKAEEPPPPPPPKTPEEVLHAALKGKNPDYTGQGKWKAVGANLEDMVLKGCNVADLSPLKGMKITGQLDCAQNRIRDLGPLAGMPLSHLVCSQNQIADLSPLKGMGLLVLSCAANQVADLAPLDGMKLQWLDCAGNRVRDIAPLKGMPLERLDCGGNQLADLSPILALKELRHLDCSRNPIAALPPLKGTSLVFLECSGTRVTDLSPLAGSQLKALGISGLEVADLSVLRDIPLIRLAFSPGKVKGDPSTSLRAGLAVLRQHRTLRFLGLDCAWQEAQTPVQEFWEQWDAKHGKN